MSALLVAAAERRGIITSSYEQKVINSLEILERHSLNMRYPTLDFPRINDLK